MATRFTYRTRIKRTGVFDLKHLYTMIYNHLADLGYHMNEKSYSEKGGKYGKEVRFFWNPYKKVTDYFRFDLDLKFLIVNLKEMEIVREGKKIRMNTGGIDIKITGYLSTDWKKKWDSSWFNNMLRKIYDDYIIRARIDEYEDKVVYEMDELTQKIKDYLSMAVHG